LFQFAPLKSGVAKSIWRQEGYMAPKPKPARFEFTVGMVLAMALTILMVMTCAVAAPSSSAIYHPQLFLLYLGRRPAFFRRSVALRRLGPARGARARPPAVR